MTLPGTEAGPDEEFEGTPIVGYTIALRNAGDGLSKPLAADRRKYTHGEVVVIAVECVVSDIQHPYHGTPDPDSLRLCDRKHIFRARNATVVDATEVRNALERQRVKLEEARGVHRLDGMDVADFEDPGDDDDELS